MMARVVGLLTVVAALFGWMSGYTLSMSSPPLPFETMRDQHNSQLLESLGTEAVSHNQSEVSDSIPEDWKCASQSQTWNCIVLHHTATEHANVESIHEEHLRRKDRDGQSWLGIGYHFVIGNGNGMGDGEIEATFRWREQLPGAHAGSEEYNQHGIGVVLVGNFETTSPTMSQLESVKRLVGFLKREHNISSDRVVGHRDVKATACPGKLFPLAEIANTVIE